MRCDGARARGLSRTYGAPDDPSARSGRRRRATATREARAEQRQSNGRATAEQRQSNGRATAEQRRPSETSRYKFNGKFTTGPRPVKVFLLLGRGEGLRRGRGREILASRKFCQPLPDIFHAARTIRECRRSKWVAASSLV